MEWGGAARTRHKFSGVRRRPPERTVWGPPRAASSSSGQRDVVWRTPKSPRARKVTFGAQKLLFRSESDFWAPKVTFYLENHFLLQKSLFAISTPQKRWNGGAWFLDLCKEKQTTKPYGDSETYKSVGETLFLSSPEDTRQVKKLCGPLRATPAPTPERIDGLH